MAAASAPAFENVFYVRRASADDVETVAALFERNFETQTIPTMLDALEKFYALEPRSLANGDKIQHFILGLLETCFMSVTVEDEEQHIVGFAALDDAPVQMVNCNGAGTAWEDWFQRAYGDMETDGMNALWVSCCIVDPEGDIMAEILRTTFSTHRDVQTLLAFVPSVLTEAEQEVLLVPFAQHFRQLRQVDEHLSQAGWATPGGVQPAVLACNRGDVINPLFIRKARVEDHDNLVAVFDAQSEVITELYGDFFIAELIEAQNEENKALVAEVDGRAVGLMCLTSDVDTNVLAQCFQLDPYDNLLKPEFMRRVREHAQAQQDGLNPPPLAATGDYMQAALMSADMDGLLASIAKHEDGRMTAAALFNALQMREFTDEIGAALPDFDKGVMALMWQRFFWEPTLEGGSLVDSSRVMESVNMFLSLTVDARREIAAAVLDQWETVADIFKLTKEARAAEEAGDGDEDAIQDAPADEEKESPPVDLVLFLKALSEEQKGPFSQEFLAQLVMVLEWWTNEDLSSAICTVPEDAYKSALEHVMYAEEGLFVGHHTSPSWLANMPQHAKDVFCVNMCCLDHLYMTQALDFLLPAFSLYPTKDYCIITQPHTAPNTPLLNAFTIVPPQPQNTFSHVLYLIHRAALLGPPRVRELRMEDQDEIPPLMDNFDEDTKVEIRGGINRHLARLDPTIPLESAADEEEDMEVHAFVAEFDDQVVGLLILQMPASDVVATLRCCYHLDDYLLVEHHEGHDNRGHCRLVHFVVNPLFANYTRRLQQGALRLCGRTVLFMEMDLQSTISPIFRELLQVAPRRPPQLKKILRKPPRVATFANVPKEEPTQDDLKETERQRLLRDSHQTKALSIVAKKLLSETKTPVNARIVVVGASDCGLSVLESLLSIPHLLFSSLTLLAPGGLEYHHSHHLPLIAGTAAYSHHELRRIMLELRVRILDSRMVQIDRAQKCCILHDQSILPYDYLVVGAGLQDDALHSLKIRSCGMVHVTEGYRSVNGAMSVADPSIRDLLVEGGTLIKSLIWNPLSYAVVYGRSLHAYCVVQGLLMRKVPPTKIILVLPPRLKDASHQLPVDAFHEGDEVERKIHSILAAMDMKVYDGYTLTGIQQDNRDRLRALILEDHSGVDDDDDDEDEDEEKRGNLGIKPRRGTLEDYGLTAAGNSLKLLSCRILITADSVNVDPDIFNSVHGNGLVYDGRLIVDHNFKTTDDGIFGAGSLCEFSRRFQRKNTQRYLRHDGFNGREVGAKLAQALLRVLDPVNGDLAAAGASTSGGPSKGGGSIVAGGASLTAGASESLPPGRSGMAEAFEGLEEESSPELLPDFFMPIAKGGFLPGNLHYYRIHSCRRSDASGTPTAQGQEVPQDKVIVTDTLDTKTGQGHFCRLTIDSFGKVDSITYLGGEELQVESLWSLVGLSETFLNLLYLRWSSGDIPDIIEFLTDEWATALFHDRFKELCREINREMLSNEDMKENINNVLETVNLKEGLSRKLLAQIRQHLPKESEKQMQDRLLKYLRKNTNHLKSYFLPENWVTQAR